MAKIYVKDRSEDRFGLLSIVFGIFGILLTLMFYFGFIVSIIGIVLGIIGLFRDAHKKFAIVGLLIGSFIPILMILVFLRYSS